MEFTKLNDFLFHSLDLCSIDYFSITISGIDNVIGENDVIDYSKNFQDEVIEEVYKNLSTMQPGTVPLYFNLLFKKIEDYKTNKDWKYYPHHEKLEHLEWQFQELLNQNSENEELLQISYMKGGFKNYIFKENNSKRLIIVERLKSEIQEIKDNFFHEKKIKEREQIENKGSQTKPLNIKIQLFFEEATKIQISYKKVEGKYIDLNFNGFNEVARFQTNLISHFEKAKTEILENLFVIEDNKAREDYLKSLRFKCLDIETNLLSCADLFLKGGKLSGELENWELGIEGYVYENQALSVKLPEKEFTVLNETDFLGDCYEQQVRKVEGLGKFIFSLCQNQQIAMNVNEDQYLNILRKKQVEKNENEVPLFNRLKWKGTPGEFGAIFDLLIDNGFIELIKDKKNMVRLLYSLFEIRSEKGEIVSSNYLYKCFKDKMKVYPNGYLKIPFSDKYHNDK